MLHYGKRYATFFSLRKNACGACIALSYMLLENGPYFCCCANAAAAAV